MAHDGEVTEPQPTGRPNARLKQSVRDMVLSMAVVIAVVGAILIVTHRPAPEAVKPVDATMALTAAAVVVGAGVILFDPIFQGLAISLMAGEIASLFLSRMAVPVLYFMAHARNTPTAPLATEATR